MLGGHRFLLLDEKRAAQHPHLAGKGVLAGLVRDKLNSHDLTSGEPGTLVKIGKHDNCRTDSHLLTTEVEAHRPAIPYIGSRTIPTSTVFLRAHVCLWAIWPTQA